VARPQGTKHALPTAIAGAKTASTQMEVDASVVAQRRVFAH
jgi:hypothetical protein